MHRGALIPISVLLIWLSTAAPALARGGGGRSSGHSKGYPTGGHHRSSTYCASCARDARGHIKRSSTQRQKFLRSQGLTRTPPGMQVDHIVPLAKGGADKAFNMQLIPKDSAKERSELK